MVLQSQALRPVSRRTFKQRRRRRKRLIMFGGLIVALTGLYAAFQALTPDDEPAGPAETQAGDDHLEVQVSAEVGTRERDLVASVTPGGPAEKAKVVQGDVILEFNGREVTDMRKLPRMVAETPIGESAEVVIWRKGKKLTLKVKLGELDEEKIALATGRRAEGGRGSQCYSRSGAGVEPDHPRVARKVQSSRKGRGRGHYRCR